MFLVPPPGLTKKKGASVISFVSGFSAIDQVSATPSLAISGVQAGDIIVAAGGVSGAGSGSNISMSGYTMLQQSVWTNFVQNSFAIGHKVATGGETTVDFTFGAISTCFMVASIFRGVGTVNGSTGLATGGTTNSINLGNYTDNNLTSFDIIPFWINRNGTNDTQVNAEPVGYAVGARADGASLGASHQDRILSLWHRPYDNTGAKAPFVTLVSFASYDHAFGRYRLDL